MRKLLLLALPAFTVSITGIASASAMIGVGDMNKAAANFSPRVWQATHQCRAKTVCDRDGKNCHTVDICH